MIVVADAGPLIALAQLGSLDLLRRLFGEVLVPPEVAREAFETRPRVRPDWVRIVTTVAPESGALNSIRVDVGERAALRVALERHADLVLVDDRRGRSAAIQLGLRIAGTVGVLLHAKRRGHVPAVRPLFDRLRAEGFRMRADLYERALELAGERA